MRKKKCKKFVKTELFLLFVLWQLWFHVKNCVNYFIGKKSWKHNGFTLFVLWQLCFHVKNCENYFVEKVMKTQRFYVVCILTTFFTRKYMNFYYRCKKRQFIPGNPTKWILHVRMSFCLRLTNGTFPDPVCWRIIRIPWMRQPLKNSG